MNGILAAFVNGALAGALVAAGVWLVLRAIPRGVLNAATRYIVWWVALIVVVALPALYLPPPAQRVVKQVANLRPIVNRPEPAPVPASSARSVVVYRPILPAAASKAARPVSPITPAPQPISPPSVRHTPILTFPLKVEETGWTPWLLTLWLSAALLLLGRLAVSCVLLERLRLRASDVPAALRAQARHWLACCSSRRRVRVAASDEIAIPVAVGPRHPSILIPAHLFELLEDAEIDQLGLHETAHLARGDDYALILQRVIEALFALHPVVRWISRRIDLEREIACDDLVIAATGHPRSYASCLTRIVEFSGGLRSSLAAATAVEDSSHLARRVDMLLDKHRHTGTRPLKVRLAAMFLLLAGVTWIAGRTPAVVAIAARFPTLPVRHNALPAPPVALLPQVQAQPAALPGKVSGSVIEDSSGNPLASAELRFHTPGKRELAADIETDPSGRFEAEGLPAGDYSVDVAKPNFITTSLKLHVPADPVMVRLIRYGVIDGQATNSSGHPLVGRFNAPGGRTVGAARITILVKAPGSEQLQTFRDTSLDQDGHYRVYDLPPGQYAVGLWYHGLPEGSGVQLYPDNGHPQFFTISGGEEFRSVDFLVTPGPSYSVTGRVELPAPKTQFQLALGLPDQPLIPIGQTLTEEDGSFRFEKVPAGTYELFAAGPTGGYTAYESILRRDKDPLFGRMRVDVTGQNVEVGTVSLSGARSLKVLLRAHGSESLPQGCPKSTTVSAASAEPWAVMFQSSAQAVFGQEQTISGLAPGRFRISARDLGKDCYQINQPIADLSREGSQPVAVEVATAGSIRGRLTGAPNPHNYSVVLLDSENGATTLATLDEEGRFTFDGLRPGHYRIAAHPSAEAAQARWIADVSTMMQMDVAGGTPTMVEIPVVTKGARQ